MAAVSPEVARAFTFLDDSLAWAFQVPTRIQPDSAWLGHVPFADWIMTQMRPSLFVELGSHSGTSYAAFCESVLRNKYPTLCFAVDTWMGDAHAGGYEETVFRDLRDFNRSRYSTFSTLLRKTFDEALGDIRDGSVDLLHIDGLHTYEAVRHDFDTWLPKLSNSAIVLFHDTTVRDREFGVWKLWEELRQRYRGFEFTHSFGLGVLQVGNNVAPALRALCSATEPQLVAKIKQRFERLGDHIEVSVQRDMYASRLLAALEKPSESGIVVL